MTRSPDKLAIAIWVLVGMEAAFAGFIPLVPAMSRFPCFFWPASIIAIALALGLNYRHWQKSNRPRQPSQSAFVVFTLVAACGMSIAFKVIQERTQYQRREFTKTLVTRSNLRGIGTTCRFHCAKHNDYPASLQELVESSDLTWKNLVSLGDPDAPSLRKETALVYSSFDYCPGAGPWRDERAVILAHERQAWSPIRMRDAHKRGRCVLFGDGRVEVLGTDEFAASLQRDRERRSELGWPLCE